MAEFDNAPMGESCAQAAENPCNVGMPASASQPGSLGQPFAPTAGQPAVPAKTLVIAEKRSVGRTLAAFLGCRRDRGQWIEGERYDAIQRNIRINHAALVDAGDLGRFDLAVVGADGEELGAGDALRVR